MAEKIWTDRQLKAITHKGSDMLVAAAAGSGKTAVLTERILRKITDDNVDIDKLLVLTFTSAAAAEMRERISGEIEKRLEENPENGRLRKQLTLISRADIVTIHSFCLKIVKNNFSVAEIDPNFRIISEAESLLLKNEVMETLFEALYESEDNEFFLNLVESFGSETDDIKLRSLVLDLYKFAYAGPFPEKWLFESAEKYNIGKMNFDDTVWAENIKGEMPEIIKYLKKCVNEMESLLDEEGAPLSYGKAIEKDKEMVDTFASLMDKSYDEAVDFLRGFSLVKLPAKNRGSDAIIAERIKYIRDILSKEFKRLATGYFPAKAEEMKDRIKRIYPMVYGLCRLTKLFMDLYMEVKKERRMAEFGDLEHLCLKVLMNEDGSPSKIAKELQEKYEEILTDEYQDTNLIQEYILSLVSKKDLGEYNRFMVGDIKQSIYRFRLANPEIFINKYSTFKEDGNQIKIDLFSNFRSRKYILDNINFIFFRLMTKEFGEIEYDDNASLKGGGFFPEYEGLGKIGSFSEVNLVYPEEAGEEEEMEDVKSIQYEARFAARRIKELLEEDFEIYDDEIKAYRKLSLGDIVILLRSMSSGGAVFAKELEEAGISAYAERSESLFESMEVMTILSFLQTIDNPYQDIPVLSVLKSPVYRLDGNRLLEISLEGEGNCFYEKVLSFSESEKGAYLKRFIADIEIWRSASKFMPSDMLIWKIYRDTGYFDYVGAEENGKVKQGRLRSFIDISSEFEKNSFKGLFKFLRYIEKLKMAGMSEGGDKVLSSDGNFVRILSIHKSKGLEFPVVFISNIGKEFYKKDLYGKVLFHSSIGIGAPFIDAENRVSYSSAAQMVLRQKILSEKFAEELRILYVAMTRAKEKLIFTGHIKNINSAAKKWGLTAEGGKELSAYSLRKGASFADWIMPALIVHKDAEILRELCFAENIPLSDDNSKWKINFISEKELALEVSEIEDEKEVESEKNIFEDEKVRERLLWKYPFANERAIPSCISISEIKKKYMEFMGEENEEQLYKSECTEKIIRKSGLTAAQKGTVMHSVMEHIDFKAEHSKESIDKLINEMVSEGLLTKEEGDFVNREKILKFFESDLGKRVAASAKVYKEESFAMEILPSEIYLDEAYDTAESGTIIHGIIDCFFEEDGDLVLFDYKTDYVPEGKEEEVAKKYKIQLSMYKKAIEAATGKRVKEAYIYFFFKDKELKLL